MEKQSKKRRLHTEIVRQMLTLATSGFGLVAALAWNNVVQELVKEYITRVLPGPESGIISLLIYAIVVTTLAVTVTLQLSRALQKLKSK